MTDYLNPHKMGSDYPVVNRAGEIQTGRVDVAPGFDSVRPPVKESLTTALDENGLARCGCGSKAEYMHSYPFCNGGLWGVYCADDKMLGCYVQSDMTADDRGSGANVGMCQTKEEARKNWNRAMGWRADE